jgi:hypothetical protein
MKRNSRKELARLRFSGKDGQIQYMLRRIGASEKDGVRANTLLAVPISHVGPLRF